MCYVEGCLARKKDTIWIVKGIEHPDGYLTAFPRYKIISTNNEIKITKLGVKDPEEYFKKLIYDSNESRLIYNKCSGRITPVLKVNEIEEFYNPFKPPICEENSFYQPCLIIENLSSRIEEAKIGLTGSSYFMENSSSDIDLLIFINPDYVDLVFEKMKKFTEEISWLDAMKILSERQYPVQRLALLKKIKNSISQRKMLGKIIFSRILVTEPFLYKECKYEILKEAEITLRGIITSERSFFYPYTYTVSILESDYLEKGKEIKVVSDRGRFSEMAHKGESVEIRGDYEIKVFSFRQMEKQVYLWSKKHYILPID